MKLKSNPKISSSVEISIISLSRSPWDISKYKIIFLCPKEWIFKPSPKFAKD